MRCGFAERFSIGWRQTEAKKGSEKARERAKVSDRSAGNIEHVTPSVGALRGWNAASRRPGI